MLSIIAANTLPNLSQAEGSDLGSSLVDGKGSTGGFAALLAQLGDSQTGTLPPEIRNLLASANTEAKPLAPQIQTARFFQGDAHTKSGSLFSKETVQQRVAEHGDHFSEWHLSSARKSIQNLSTAEIAEASASQALPPPAASREAITEEIARINGYGIQPRDTLPSPDLTQATANTSDETTREASQNNLENNSMTTTGSQSEILALLLPPAQNQRPNHELKTEKNNDRHATKTLHSNPAAEGRLTAEEQRSLFSPSEGANNTTAWNAQAQALSANTSEPTSQEKAKEDKQGSIADLQPQENPYAGLQASLLLQAPPPPQPSLVKEAENQEAPHLGTIPLAANTQSQSNSTITSERPAMINEANPVLLEKSSPESAIIAAPDTKPESAVPSTFAMALHDASQTTKQAENSTHQSQIPTHVRDPNWSAALGERVTWLAKQDIQSAEIHLNPPQLGPVHISISLSGDQATASFAVANVEVRQAIENSIPQLRDMLASSGIQLGDANVGAQSQQQAREQAGQFSNGQRSRGEDAILLAPGNNEPSAGVAPLNRGRGMVDLFA